jgi:hypothetical protein
VPTIQLVIEELILVELMVSDGECESTFSIVCQAIALPELVRLAGINPYYSQKSHSKTPTR